MSSKTFNLKQQRKYHYAPIRMGQKPGQLTVQMLTRMRQQKLPIGGMQMVQLLQKTV